ncbi:MAG: 6-phosphogluconolactonase [Bifidobacteriaceae bacterium]|jgi:glucosamine-6-phosphate deaminase|nr:6-phosphogluconolactonase [Bifidobacteriaceae bacterium]
MTAHVREFLSPLVLADALAGEIAEGIATARAAGNRYVLGCPSGRSPHPTYRALAQIVRAANLPLGHVILAMMDDYAVREPDGTFGPVPADAHYSCRRFARDEIAGPLSRSAPEPIPDRSVWFPAPHTPGAYDDRLRDAGGVDVFILASGATDGHVAFNPPGTPADSRTRVIELATSTRLDNLGTFPGFSGIRDVPSYGLSVGIATITELSKRAVMVVTGAHKRLAYARLTGTGHYDPAWPATVVHACRDGSVYADGAAVGKVPVPAHGDDGGGSRREGERADG